MEQNSPYFDPIVKPIRSLISIPPLIPSFPAHTKYNANKGVSRHFHCLSSLSIVSLGARDPERVR